MRARATSTAKVVAVLDNEAAQAVADVAHPKHRRMAEVLRAARTERALVLVPTAVRVEAGLPRSSSTTAGLGRFKVADVPLSTDRADQAIALAQGLSTSAVDAIVAQCAAEHGATGALVTIYTSDVRDLERLCTASAGRIAIRRV